MLDAPVVLTALPIEASTRRFHRASSGARTFIAMDSPPETEDNAQFLALSQCFRDAGVAAPEVLAADLDRGFLVVEDFGDDLFIDAYARGETDRCLDLAVDVLLRIQGLRSDLIPPYTVERFVTELGIFRQWVLEALIQTAPEPFIAMCEPLISATQNQPQTTIHRDFHSRNLLLRANGEIGVVDFQDALVGPVTYDLASLLHDCYVALPQPAIDRALHRYREGAERAGIAKIADRHDFQNALELTAIQRQLKAAGIFVRLKLQHGRSSHLGDVVPVLRRVQRLASKYPDLSEAARWLARTVIPATHKEIEKLT